ncbi:MAG: ABC transporter ATP-binding protein [Hydrogenophaga sp.]|uniref:ABC transporter ATP-binding protein n=1 Tax=Hydrogenophaga sp. TaxID=1904254 RepID=UPI00262B219A|nr:ABC transporter ATP-binding protein [Hydrogenophaga sp.]MDD3785806.1 ABC transporter ATP-binding protein [Hydrogenophaga sp.]
MTAPYIHLENVDVDFPIFNASSLSLKNKVLKAVTGGRISTRHDGHVVVRGLDGINLRLDSGERLGIIGHNGAGKTTLLRVLSGIYHPTSGRAEIHGHSTSLIDISLGIDPEATGRENVTLRGTLMGLSPKQINAMMDEIIEFSGLGAFIDMPFRTYSSGMQMRLAFSVSTTVRPEILIMDEWLSTGDLDFKERAKQRMHDIVDSTDILILASHSKDLLLSNCSRVIWLEQGRIKMDGPAEQIVDLYFGA